MNYLEPICLFFIIDFQVRGFKTQRKPEFNDEDSLMSRIRSGLKFGSSKSDVGIENLAATSNRMKSKYITSIMVITCKNY